MKDKTIDDEPIIMSNYCIIEIKKISYIPGKPQVLKKGFHNFEEQLSDSSKKSTEISILDPQFYNLSNFTS